VKRILHITPDFNYSCGRSKLVYLYLKYFEKHDQYETHFITNGGDALDRLKDLPKIKFTTLNFSTGKKNIFYYNSFYRSLKKYVEKNNIDIIHTHHRFPELVSVNLAEKIKLKTITSVHGFVTGYESKSFKSDKIISVSKSGKEYLVKNFNVDENKIIILYNPVEDSKQNENENLKRKFSLYDNHKIILFPGRINSEKGYDKLIRAYEIACVKNKKLMLIICGQIEDENINKLRNKLTVPVIYLPPLENIKQLYSISDVVILPSKKDSFPYVMLEAGINKKSFIGGNTGGIAEFIEDGVNGLLINPENENEIAEKILYVVDNKDKANLLGENLYKKVKENCDYKIYFSKVEEIYNSLLSN